LKKKDRSSGTGGGGGGLGGGLRPTQGGSKGNRTRCTVTKKRKKKDVKVNWRGNEGYVEKPRTVLLAVPAQMVTHSNEDLNKKNGGKEREPWRRPEKGERQKGITNKKINPSHGKGGGRHALICSAV